MPVFLKAQLLPSYYVLRDSAKSHLEKKEYRMAGRLFNQAFRLQDRGEIKDRIFAAYAWSQTSERDSAFIQLSRIAGSSYYKEIRNLESDEGFIPLRTDSRWAALALQLKEKEAAEKARFDKKLAAELDSIFETDQEPRQRMDVWEEKYGARSAEMQSLFKEITRNDSLNQIRICQILDQKGWLGVEEIGQKGNSTLFLVIQHAPLPIQEKYLPMMRKAVAEGKAQGYDLALLEDRVALRQGRLQTYGSQIGTLPSGEPYVKPLLDPDHVNERRKSVGLLPIETYLENWKLTWDVENYKKRLPEFLKANPNIR